MKNTIFDTNRRDRPAGGPIVGQCLLLKNKIKQIMKRTIFDKKRRDRPTGGPLVGQCLLLKINKCIQLLINY